MAKRKAKKMVKPSVNLQGDVKDTQTKKLNSEMPRHAFSDHEVERRITAIHAIRDAEIEDLLTRLRLLRSCLTKEQLNTPVQQFFKENCPNLSVVKNEKDGELELELKARDCNQAPFQRTSMACLNLAGFMPSIEGLEFSSKSAREHFVGVASMQIPDFIMEENSETQILGRRDSFQTPGVCSFLITSLCQWVIMFLSTSTLVQYFTNFLIACFNFRTLWGMTCEKLSIGMTPKTLRLPKHGEMLLSVHGSPLGLYKEDNMEAIAESEEA